MPVWEAINLEASCEWHKLNHFLGSFALSAWWVTVYCISGYRIKAACGGAEQRQGPKEGKEGKREGGGRQERG